MSPVSVMSPTRSVKSPSSLRARPRRRSTRPPSPSRRSRAATRSSRRNRGRRSTTREDRHATMTTAPINALALALVVMAVALIGAADASAAQQRVLLVTEARGFVHPSIADASAFFARLGRRSSRYDVVHLAGAAQLTRRRLRHADGVVFANTTGELPLPDRRAFLRFVRRGGAFVGTHSASDTLHSWHAYARLLGGEFARHGSVQPGRLVVAPRPHPVTRGLPRTFSLTDEFYEFTAPP